MVSDLLDLPVAPLMIHDKPPIILATRLACISTRDGSDFLPSSMIYKYRFENYLFDPSGCIGKPIKFPVSRDSFHSTSSEYLIYYYLFHFYIWNSSVERIFSFVDLRILRSPSIMDFLHFVQQKSVSSYSPLHKIHNLRINLPETDSSTIHRPSINTS